MASGDRADIDRGFGRDGISGLVTPHRAMRSRDVSRPTREDVEAAQAGADALPARNETHRR